MQSILEILRSALRGTEYENKVFLVGGYARDKLLNRPLPNDLDLVLEGDSLALARLLYEKGAADHKPVVYPKFGTAMINVQGTPVEIVTARAESYRSDSRKPVQVKPATLQEDAMRRDFTINTLLENLHTGEIVDLLGKGLEDLQARLLRTPLPPKATFHEDPLRMMRAARFATQLGFEIETQTYEAMRSEAKRLKIISAERIREELMKILSEPTASRGLQMLLETDLLEQFAPELLPMVGCEQNQYHLYDVWTHTLKAINALPPSADWRLRLAALLHDVGKPETRSVDERGNVHFYEHQYVGERMTKEWMRKMTFSNEQIAWVSRLVRMHMRPGEYSKRWKDSTIRRLIRDAGELLEPLLQLCAADAQARRPDMSPPDLQGLRARIAVIEQTEPALQWHSPLDGKEIMELLQMPSSKMIGRIKNALIDAVIEGSLCPEDKESAKKLALELIQTLQGETPIPGENR